MARQENIITDLILFTVTISQQTVYNIKHIKCVYRCIRRQFATVYTTLTQRRKQEIIHFKWEQCHDPSAFL
jgi:hypothetical protein